LVQFVAPAAPFGRQALGMDQLAHVRDLCRRMEDLAFEGDLPPFDRVRITTGADGGDELWFLWEERQLCVVVEIAAGAEQLAAALSGAVAGDAVLN
jgi:hypothetical protein